MMMSLLGLTIIVIFGVVSSQNHDVNLQTPRKRNVEATTLIPPDDSKAKNEGILEKLEFLILDTSRRFQSIENQLSSCSSSSVVQNIEENLEAKVERLDKNIQELMDATRNLSSDVETIKRNGSCLINVTRSLVDLSLNSEVKQIINEGLQAATLTSCPLNITPNKQYPKNCRDVRESEKTASGNYMIQPEHAPEPFEVVCDFETRGGGWTVIQRRFDGSQDFYLYWQNYKNGFGNLGGEFWIGLENIHLLTGFEVNELLIEIGTFESENKSAIYSQFSVGSEMEGYSLNVLGAYSGNSGDCLTQHAGRKFTTKDHDQDDFQSGNCAELHSGAWWYINCAYSNLNGKYFDRGQGPDRSIFWKTFQHNHNYSGLKHTRMLVRPKV